jgi:hypothetical protein
MDTAEGKEIDLDSLTEKLRSKEYKATAKEAVSKDPAVRLKALRKLKDVRYYTMGGCLMPLIESISSKKVR